MGPNFVDEIDCGNFFDQIDDLIEFPPENECGGGGGDLISSGDLPSMWNALPDSDPLFSGSHGNAASDLSTELSVPYEDIVQLEWLSTFMEDSFSGRDMTLGKENLPMITKNEPPQNQNQFQISSPVSVLESSSSSSSSSNGKTVPLGPNHRGPQRARSKRPRPATFNPRPTIPPFAEFENFAESTPLKKSRKPFGPEQPKNKKRKNHTGPGPIETAQHENNHHPPQAAVRKCMHCEITKTPQWRAGPMGPKTLCNACGVRHKSGRLFPEYRPAASPTFVPSLHSNSHKKVVEMRSKVEPGPAINDAPIDVKPEFVPINP